MKVIDKLLAILDYALTRIFGIIGGALAGLLVACVLICSGAAQWAYFPGLSSKIEAILYYLALTVGCGFVGLIGGIIWPLAFTRFVSPFVNLFINEGWSNDNTIEYRRKPDKVSQKK